MNRIKFGEVVSRIDGNEDRLKTDRLYYVGGEHYDEGALEIERKGLIKEKDLGYQFHYPFESGDVLFMTKNPHLKKCGFVNFQGICSVASFVLRSVDERRLLQRFLPIITQTDSFWNYLEANKSGSVNYFVTWRTLANYEFNLPPIEEQARIADLLWAMNDTKKAYRNLLAATDELVKARFVEMFGDLITNSKSWPVYCFSEVATTRLGKMLDSKKQTGKNKFPYLGNTNVQWFKFDLNNLKQMDFDEEDQKEFCLQDGDLLVCEGGEIGRCAVWHNELQPCYYQKAIHRIRCNKEKLSSDFLSWWFRYYAENGGFIHLQESKSTIAHLPKEKLNHLQIAVPPLELQETFIQFTKRVLLIHKNLDKSIESANEMLKSYLETVTA